MRHVQWVDPLRCSQPDIPTPTVSQRLGNAIAMHASTKHHSVACYDTPTGTWLDIVLISFCSGGGFLQALLALKMEEAAA